MQPGIFFRSSAISFALVVIGLAPTVGTRAQADSGVIEGSVSFERPTDDTWAMVTLEGTGLLQPRKVAAGRDGRFRFIAVPPGDYTVIVTDVTGLHRPVRAQQLRCSLGRITDAGAFHLRVPFPDEAHHYDPYWVWIPWFHLEWNSNGHALIIPRGHSPW